jgi:hydrogenase maturation protein HypF
VNAVLPPPLTRRRIRVRGVVQGVGFRPFVHRTAAELGLAGTVRNDARGVLIDVQGAALGIESLLRRLRASPPPLARIDAIETEDCPPELVDTGFTVLTSETGRTQTSIGADAVVCDACLAEMCNPEARRWRYPFINCTHCGPRYTLVRGLPFDRANTSMAAFVLCARCAHEYRDPTDRRFHAEANACPDCGPRLWIEGEPGREVARADAALRGAYTALRQGAIVALKSLGGFHLVCDAENALAVARLRARKKREAQPFALMVLNTASADRWVECDPVAAKLLTGRERPIVLLPRRRPGPHGVADGLASLGLMLPATPLQYLLFHEAAGRPVGTAWLADEQPLTLVMTSANPHGEPLVIDNAEARGRLHGIADLCLMHDRDIVTRCDDSVLTVHPGLAPLVVRRARGHAPDAIPLACAGPPVLATGAGLKNTLCLTRGAEAFLSPHLGDLDSAAARRAFDLAATHLRQLVDAQPALLVHDLHPDFHSTRYAIALAAERGLPALGVQHHHAHAAAVLAEHGCRHPALALTLDGIGLGDDGGLWGGELLHVDGARCRRLASLAELPLAGGDAAAREPWRCGAAALHLLGRTDAIATRFAAEPGAEVVARLLARGTRCTATSALGRWFDAAAALLGVRARASYEAQAAMELETLAWRVAAPTRAGELAAREPVLPAWTAAPLPRLDLRSLFASLVEERDAARGAVRFHAVLATQLAGRAIEAAQHERCGRIVLAGGCLLNGWLRVALVTQLSEAGLEVLEPRRLPPGDGALSLGQAWVGLRSMQGV